MDRSEWIGKLELLHAGLRRGDQPSPQDLAWYRSARERFLAVAVEAQNTAVLGDERPRQAIRLERAVPVRLGSASWSIIVTTNDLAIGGFSVVTDAAVSKDRVAWAELELPGRTIRLPVRLVSSVPAGGFSRVSFAFQSASPDAVAVLEDFILDQLLPRVVFWDGVLEKIRD